MIVQPTPTAPRSPVRRALRIVGLAAPVILLLVVVVVGIAGPGTSTPPAPRSTPATVAVAGAGAGVSPAPVPTAAPPAFPAVAGDLEVRSIPEARDWLDNVTPGPVAVAGWLTSLHAYGDCPAAGGDTRGTLGPMCVRRARFGAGPDGTGDPYIRLTIPAGTRLPPELENKNAQPAAVPMVLIGHTGYKEAGCDANSGDCRDDLVVERVTWADGVAFDPGPVYDAYLAMAPPAMMLRNLDVAEARAIGSFGTILQAALIRPSTVAAVDPVAARALGPSYLPGTLVWYVRGLQIGIDIRDPLHGAGPPRYSWLVLDYETGRTIARGPRTQVSP